MHHGSSVVKMHDLIFVLFSTRSKRKNEVSLLQMFILRSLVSLRLI